MDEAFLYQQIAGAVRRQILQGELKPGERLPSVREMTARWDCTIGTVQHAYQELARQGLVASRAGQGTHVVAQPPVRDETPLRRAALVHRAEAFLLQVLAAGYAPTEVEDAIRQALDRWRSVTARSTRPVAHILRFAGSHDLAVTWLAAHFDEVAPDCVLQISLTGSLGGLIALAEGRADVAGCHLWDEETDTYNIPFVQRLLPGQHIALVTLAYRQLGLIVPPGNPANVRELQDLARSGSRFINRQGGSGTRVWLDAWLRRLGISPQAVQGYGDEKVTHSDVALAIAEGQAGVGLGLAAAARAYGLGFVPLTRERYDLAMPEVTFEQEPAQKLVEWLGKREQQERLAHLAGYDLSNAGQVEWVG